MKIHPTASRRQLGLTLVELMIALVLGLVVIGAVVNLFLTNRQTYRTTENLARMQENLRIAYELMARDVREAGATACSVTCNPKDPKNGCPVANVLNGSTNWSWQGETLIAYAPGATLPSFAPDNVAAGSPVLSITKGTDPTNEIHVTSHNKASTLTSPSTANIKLGDILFVCKGADPYQPSNTNIAAIFQASRVVTEGKFLKIEHNTENTVKPGNCTKCLPSFSFSCDKGTPDPSSCADFTGGTLLKFQLIRWYIGTNDRGGTSLYRKVGDGIPLEMVPDIDQLTLSFLVKNDTTYQSIASVADWTKVVAVRVMVRSVSTDKVGTDGQPLRREYPFTIALRNRLN